MKKVLISTVSFAMLSGVVTPFSTTHAATKNEVNDVEAIQVSQAEIDEAQKVVDIINSLDEKLNMNDFTKNDLETIESLNNDEREFYNQFKEATERNGGQLDEEGAINVINSVYHETIARDNAPVRMAAASSVGSVKDYKLSNQEVKDIADIAGVHGTGWGFVTGIAARFGKKPTILSMLILAVPALGAIAINRCNKNGKGVIITDLRIGATHSFSCRAR